MARMLQALKNLEARSGRPSAQQAKAAERPAPSDVAVVARPALAPKPERAADSPASGNPLAAIATRTHTQQAEPKEPASAGAIEDVHALQREPEVGPANPKGLEWTPGSVALDFAESLIRKAAADLEPVSPPSPPTPAPVLPPPLPQLPPPTSGERLAKQALADPLRSSALKQLVERLEREIVQCDAKVVTLVGLGENSPTHELLLSVAMLLAEQGRQILIVDADFSRRALTESFQAVQVAGLAELLRTHDPGDKLCRLTATRKLSFLPTGQLRHLDLAANALTLEETVRALTAENSLLLIDGGSSREAAATTLARLSDATYFVVRLGTIEADEAQAAASAFRAAGARLMGCVAT